ncbi:MAG: hypothetical protein RMJ98_08125 [Myxococcales bacterium]|nr:hypothetical protein [Polyangiaceae bacterium]MDW8249253.1 hypothetical protein [Myxococcales bacterium]
MSDVLLFQRRVAGVSLEILRENDEARATVAYPYPDPRFERGGFPLVTQTIRWLGRRLSGMAPAVLFLVELAPCAGAEVPPESPLDLDDMEGWLAVQREGTVGVLQPCRGLWLPAVRGLDELERYTAPMTQASAEESRLRLLLLEREASDARGWDIAHEDGITTLGRWRVELKETPAPLDPEDVAPVSALLGALADELVPRLANGKGH